MEIILSPLAEKKLDMLLEYLEEHWGESSKNKFIEILVREFDSLSIQPFRCAKTATFSELYNCVITKQTSAIYKVNEEKSIIEIVTIFDNRQDPKKLKSELKRLFG